MGLFEGGLFGGAFGGSGGLGGMFDTGADEAYAQNMKNLKLIKEMFGRPWEKGGSGTLFGQMIGGYNKGTPLMQEAVENAKTGASKAKSALGAQGTEAYKQIGDMTTQATSAARQRGVSSGLYNSTAGITAENQARYQGQRAQGALGAQLGQQHAGLEMATTAATNQALGNLANYYAQKGRDMGSLGSQFSGAISQFQFQPGQSPFQQIAPLAGYAMGSFMGG